MKKEKTRKIRPRQKQKNGGRQSKMKPEPQIQKPDYHSGGKLERKVAIITGGDSGIGRSVAVYFAREGADVAVIYLKQHADANETKRLVEREGGKCLLIPGDVTDENFCKEAVKEALETFGKINILVNNAAMQAPQDSIEAITQKQLFKTFETNIFSMFYMTKAALKYMKEKSVIINSASVTAYRGSKNLIDYSSTKGAIVAFTRSLALALVDKKIRVNAVAPGPIWTPLIPSTYGPEKVSTFGSDTPLKRAGEPAEVAPSYVFLASEDASYITGQVIHPNGGEIVNA